MSPSSPFAWRTVATTFLAAMLLQTLPSTGSAQSASEIMDRALERYEQRAAGINDYTVVQSTEGIMTGMAGANGANRMTLYFEKTMVDGHPVFVARNAVMDSLMQMQERAGTSRSPAETIRLMKDHATLEGSDAVEGHDCWVLRVSDPAALARLQEPGAESPMKLKTMGMCLDKKDYVPRRLTMDGEMSMTGQARPITMTSIMSDYRDVDGLLYPFKTEITMSGISSSSMSPEDREKTRKQLEEAKARMADMPAAQRAMMEKMMGGQLEKMEQMLADDALTLTVVVQDLKVNAGPPDQSGGGTR